MFDRVIHTNSDIFDAETGAYIGKAYFTLTEESEKSFLNFLNYAKVPELLNLYDFDIIGAPKDYHPDPFTKNKRNAVLYASVRDEDSGAYLPLMAYLRFDALTRGNLSGSGYHADSVELSNIQPVRIDLLI